MNRIKVSAALACMLVAGMALPGCNGEIGPIWTTVTVPQPQSQFRTELEFVPNAELVRVDTSPQWALGRYAYRRGADRLLVMSRVILYPDRSKSDTVYQNQVNVPMQEQELERAWITIPVGTSVGQVLKVEDLEYRFLTGYDHGMIKDANYILPNVMLGTVTLVEERPDVAIFDLNVEVRPERRTNWMVKGRFEVPITLTGIRAKAMEASDQIYVVRGAPDRNADDQEPAPPTQPLLPPADPNAPANSGAAIDSAPTPPLALSPVVADPLTAPTPPTDPAAAPAPTPTPPADPTANPGTPTPPTPAPAVDPAANSTTVPPVPSVDTAPQPTGVQSLTIAGKTLIGKWIGQHNQFELKMQLQADGRFVYASTRPNADPYVRWGTYKVKGDYIIMSVERFEYVGISQLEDGKKQFMVLRGSWAGDDLVLDGDLGSREGRSGKAHVQMKLGNYPDMNFSPPPRGEKSKPKK